MKDCKNLLLAGDVFYFPDILIKRQVDNRFYGERESEDSEEASIGPLCELVIQNRKITDSISGETIKSQLLRSILEVDLPYIENVDLETFSKITSDEKDATQKFRDFLRLKFVDLTENEGSVHFDRSLAKISLEIQDGVRALKSDFKRIERKTAFQLTGAIIGATTASLVALNSAAFGELPQILGTSGGMLAIANALEQYLSEKSKLQDSPYYYLWLFRKKA